MDLHEFLDAVFYKDDKKTGERKVSCCKLLIVVVIILMVIGMIGNATDSDKDNTKKDDTKSLNGNESSNNVDMMEALDIEPFAEDTVVSVWNKDFLIPEGYGENINARNVETKSEDGLTMHNGLYMYYNGQSYISIGYISFEGFSMDDGMLSDDGVWENIDGYEGKLVHDDGYSFEFIENGNSYTIYADSEADIEKVLI